MIALADIIRQYRAQLLTQYGHLMLPSHHRAMSAMTECRTGVLGSALWECQQCAATTCTPMSCGHRNCPQCQHLESTAWLDRQREKLLPVNYYLLTFTLPAQLRETAWRHQKAVFNLMFKTVSNTLKQFSLNHDKLGAEPGMTLILHTHTRQLEFHPHIHVLMPGGVIDRDKLQWKTLPGRYLFNEFNLARVFRAKCLDAFNKLTIELPAGVPDEWVVDCRLAGSGEPALKYLARYLYRGVISERSIIDNTDGRVTFEYKDSETKKIMTRTLTGAEFLWKLLRHVLPLGFQRARHYGILHHNSRVWLKRLQLLLHVHIEPRVQKVKQSFECACGKGVMVLIKIWRNHQVVYRSARASPG